MTSHPHSPWLRVCLLACSHFRYPAQSALRGSSKEFRRPPPHPKSPSQAHLASRVQQLSRTTRAELFRPFFRLCLPGDFLLQRGAVHGVGARVAHPAVRGLAGHRMPGPGLPRRRAALPAGAPAMGGRPHPRETLRHPNQRVPAVPEPLCDWRLDARRRLQQHAPTPVARARRRRSLDPGRRHFRGPAVRRLGTRRRLAKEPNARRSTRPRPRRLGPTAARRPGRQRQWYGRVRRAGQQRAGRGHLRARFCPRLGGLRASGGGARAGCALQLRGRTRGRRRSSVGELRGSERHHQRYQGFTGSRPSSSPLPLSCFVCCYVLVLCLSEFEFIPERSLEPR